MSEHEHSHTEDRSISATQDGQFAPGVELLSRALKTIFVILAAVIKDLELVHLKIIFLVLLLKQEQWIVFFANHPIICLLVFLLLFQVQMQYITLFYLLLFLLLIALKALHRILYFLLL